MNDTIKLLPGIGECSFDIGERLVSKDVYENFIKGKKTFQLGAPGTNSFFFNKVGANKATRSYEAAVNAGFTKGDILNTIKYQGNELVRIRFDTSKIDNVLVPGVSKVPGGVGDGIIPGTNSLFTGNGYVKNYLGHKGFSEYIGSNVIFSTDDIISVEYLGKIKKH